MRHRFDRLALLGEQRDQLLLTDDAALGLLRALADGFEIVVEMAHVSAACALRFVLWAGRGGSQPSGPARPRGGQARVAPPDNLAPKPIASACAHRRCAAERRIELQRSWRSALCVRFRCIKQTHAALT